jgi:hypothetical protein
MKTGKYYFKMITGMSFDEAVEKVTASLAEEDFGVLTRIDVRRTMKEKLGVDFRPYIIFWVSAILNLPWAHFRRKNRSGSFSPATLWYRIWTGRPWYQPSIRRRPRWRSTI